MTSDTEERGSEGLRLITVGRSQEMQDALSVRRAVFIAEQGVSEDEEIDEYDGDPAETTGAVHVVAYLDGKTVATGRLLIDGSAGGHAKIGRVAVRHDQRRLGLGTAVMAALHEEAQRRGFQGITVAAQLQAMPFYERLGYGARGEVFLDAGIEHRWMDLSFRR